ncbi:hypothetical protein AB0368_01950 [Actinoplanes sp. NPDC051475]|uniref:hypothetical protein n=1 Tax=Actinoplanes sp. NPDC051475 TaxID=3157225 RepID=UPI00344EA42A
MSHWRDHRRTGVAAVLAGLLVGAVVGLAACDGENPSSLPTARSSERPASGEPATTRSPESGRATSREAARATSAEPGRTTTPAPATRTTKPAETVTPAETTTRLPTSTRPPTSTRAATSTRPPTSAAVAGPGPAPARTTTPAATTPTPAGSASALAVAAGSQGLEPFGWLLLIALIVAVVVGGMLVYRSQQRSAWDTEARALESETRAFVSTRLPPLLSTTTVDRRGLSWPPVRAGLADLVVSWNALTARASGEDRRTWSLRVSALLEDLIAAVDAENDALAAGRDRMLLRSRVDRAEQALAAVLTGQPQPEPPAAGEPGPPAFQT